MSMFHVCGGTILTGGSGETAHSYCDRCGAFAYDVDGESQTLPTGTSREANREAYDAGEETSPPAICYPGTETPVEVGDWVVYTASPDRTTHDYGKVKAVRSSARVEVSWVVGDGTVEHDLAKTPLVAYVDRDEAREAYEAAGS